MDVFDQRYVPAAVRGRYFGIRNTILGGVSSIVLFIGGQILEHYPGGQGFNVLFIICGICALLNMTAYFFYPNLPFETSTGIGLGGFNQMVFTFTIGDTPKSERPMYIATYSALTGFAGFLGPILGGGVNKVVADLPNWVQEYGISGKYRHDFVGAWSRGGPYRIERATQRT